MESGHRRASTRTRASARNRVRVKMRANARRSVIEFLVLASFSSAHPDNPKPRPLAVECSMGGYYDKLGSTGAGLIVSDGFSFHGLWVESEGECDGLVQPKSSYGISSNIVCACQMPLT